MSSFIYNFIADIVKFELTTDEMIIYDLLFDKKTMKIDEIIEQSELTASKVAAVLLNFEFEGIIKCLPGKINKLV